MSGKFYVYTLTDPRDGSVFYVGKGSNVTHRGLSRFRAHVHQARLGYKSGKCERIRQILGAGLEVGYEAVGRFEREEDAYAHEGQLIKLHCQTLTNCRPGGRGKMSGSGRQVTITMT